MEGKCRFCKSQLELGILSKNELKLAQHKVPSVKDNDLFCKRCRMFLKAQVDKSRIKRQQKQATLSTSSPSLSVLTSQNPSVSEDSKSSTSSSKRRRTQNDKSSSEQISSELMQYVSQENLPSQPLPSSQSASERMGPPLQPITSSQSSSERMNPPPLPLVPTIVVQTNANTSSSQNSSEPIVPRQRPIVRRSTIRPQPESSSSSEKGRPAQRSIRPSPVIQNAPIDEGSISSDEEYVLPKIPGPAHLSNVQPLIRKRRDEPPYEHEDDIPIYRRKNTGG